MGKNSVRAAEMVQAAFKLADERFAMGWTKAIAARALLSFLNGKDIGDEIDDDFLNARAAGGMPAYRYEEVDSVATQATSQ